MKFPTIMTICYNPVSVMPAAGHLVYKMFWIDLKGRLFFLATFESFIKYQRCTDNFPK